MDTTSTASLHEAPSSQNTPAPVRLDENALASASQNRPPGDLRSYFDRDVPAGLVVFLVALPLCLGIALASGAPLLSGLIAGVVAGLIITPLSGSPLSVSGPAAGLTVIVLNALTQLGSYRTFLVAVVLGGVFQLALGVGRAGVIPNFVPSSVIKGMLSAIGLVLILKQLPHAIGYDSTPDLDEQLGAAKGIVFEYNAAMHEVGIGATFVALVSLVLLALWPRLSQRRDEHGFLVSRGGIFRVFGAIPAALLVVFVGVLLNALFITLAPSIRIKPEHLVALPVAKGLNDLAGYVTFPDFSQLSNPKVYTVALTLAIVASLETLLCVEAVDKLDPLRRKSNTTREMFAQGTGNIISGLIGGLPITSVIVRSAANVNAGGRTRVSGFTHGLFLLLSAVFLAGLLNYIPLACLAAVLLFTGSNLASPSIFRGMFRAGWDQFVPFLVTVVCILATDLLKGIGVGLLVSLIWFGGPIFRSLRSGSLLKPFQIEGAGSPELRIVLGPDVTFLAKNALMKTLASLPENVSVEIDGSQSNFVDYDIVDQLRSFAASAASRNQHVHLLGIREIARAAGAH